LFWPKLPSLIRTCCCCLSRLATLWSMPLVPWKSPRPPGRVSDEITQDDVEAFLKRHYGSDVAPGQEDIDNTRQNIAAKMKATGGRLGTTATEPGDNDEEMEYSDKDLGETLVLCNLLQDMGNEGQQANDSDGMNAVDFSDTCSMQSMEDLYEGQHDLDGSSTAEPLSDTREMGTVEKFTSKRGFGLIRPDDGSKNIFVHWTQISSHDKWPQLIPGMRVEYVKAIQRGRLAATSVTGPGGALIVTTGAVNNSQRKLSPFTLTGTATWFHKAGYGFIRIDSKMEWPQRLSAGSEIYVSREDLVVADGSPCSLEPGMRVQFKVYKPRDREVAAAEVTALGGSPLTRVSSGHASSSSWNGGSSNSWYTSRSSSSWYAGTPDRFSSSSWYAGTPGRAFSSSWYAGSVDRGPPSSWYAGNYDGFKGGNYDGFKGKSSKSFGKGAFPGGKSTGSGMVPRLPGVQRAITKRAEGPVGRGRSPSMHRGSLIFPRSSSRSRSEQWPRVRKFFGQADEEFMEELYDDASVKSEPLHPETRERSWRSGSVPCKFFAQGRCSKGNMCQFSHEQPQAVRPRCPPARTASPGCRKVPCRFYVEGRCRKGDQCTFSHSPESLQPIPLERKVSMECEFYGKGRCTRGAACPFAHGPQELYDITQLKAQKQQGEGAIKKDSLPAPALV